MHALVSSQLSTYSPGSFCRCLRVLCAALSPLALCPVDSSCLALPSLSAPSQSRKSTGLCLHCPACPWAWKPSWAEKWSNPQGSSPLFPVSLSFLVDVQWLESCIFIYFVHFCCCCCFRQENNSGLCYSILAENGSLGLASTLNCRRGNLGEQDRNVSCYKSINFISVPRYICSIYSSKINWTFTTCSHYDRWRDSDEQIAFTIYNLSCVWLALGRPCMSDHGKNGLSGPVKLKTRPWDMEHGASHFRGTSWSLSEVFISFC